MMTWLWHFWNSISLIRRIAAGLIVGVLLALVKPAWTWPAGLGGLFVAALKAVAPVLVFFLVISAVPSNLRKSTHL